MTKDPLRWHVLGGGGSTRTQACSLGSVVRGTGNRPAPGGASRGPSVTHSQGQLSAGATCLMVAMTVANVYQSLSSARPGLAVLNAFSHSYHPRLRTRTLRNKEGS